MPAKQISEKNTLSRLSRELDALRRITRSINATSDLRSILNEIVTTATEVLGADSSTIYLLDEARQRLTLKATTGLSTAAINHGTLAMGEGLTGWAAKNRQVVSVRDAQHDPRFRIVPNTGERVFQSLMAAPLISQDRVIGAINVQTRRMHTWTEADIEFGTLKVEREAHRVWIHIDEVELTALEFKLLVTLFDRRNRVQTRSLLLSDVWGIEADITTRTVSVVGGRLRAKRITVGVPWPGMYAPDVSTTLVMSKRGSTFSTSARPCSRFMKALLVI